MTWNFGGGFGGHGGGASHNHGLPFACVPEEMRDGIRRIIEDEPEHPARDIEFRYCAGPHEQARLTLRKLLLARWRLCISATVLVAMISVVGQAGPKLINIAIDDGMLGHHRMSVVALVAALYFAALALTSVCQRWQAQATGRLAASVMYDLRIRIFTHLQRLGLDFYTEAKTGVVMTRMTSDIENLQQLLQDGLSQVAIQALTMVVIAAVMLSMNVKLALITIVVTVTPLLALSIWFRNRSEAGYDRVRDGIANVLADLSENLHGIRVVAMNNRQRHNILRHRNVVGTYRVANNYTANIAAVYGMGTQLLGYLSQAVLLAIGGQLALHHSLTVGELVAFFLYVNRFFAPIQLLVQQYNVYQQSQASLSKLRSLLSTQPNVAERVEATELPPVEGVVEFEHVDFGYSPADPVLTDVSLTIQSGESVAFVGPTGAGKSTLAKLVVRLYDPDQGRVLVDGHDLRDVTLHSLRCQFGVVPQEPFLFAGNLRDNIAFARPDASDAEVEAAVHAVGLDDLVARLPGGVHGFIHERGQSLSSGERQLIALARTFLAQPRVIVLDEATSNLDLQSEAKIEAALDVLLEGRTAILIAHRLTTAIKADRIVVIDDGHVVETGSHDDLLAASGRYAAMFRVWEDYSAVEPTEAGSVTSTPIIR